jgi:hypothetical protein
MAEDSGSARGCFYREVIGIVGNVRQDDLAEPPAPGVYRSTSDSWLRTFVIRPSVASNRLVARSRPRAAGPCTDDRRWAILAYKRREVQRWRFRRKRAVEVVLPLA